MTPTFPITEIELAKLWNVSMDTLARIRARGDIGYTRIGGRIRYTEKHIQDYLEANDSDNLRRASGRRR